MEKEFKAAIIKADSQINSELKSNSDPEKMHNKEMLVMNINQNKKIIKMEESLEAF